MKLRFYISLLLVLASSAGAQAQNANWGLLGNSGFDTQPVKAAFFFAGNWRNGTPFYGATSVPANNSTYTVWPKDSRHLGWSESSANRDFALNPMSTASVNVVAMSYWGIRGSSNWISYAPMQTSTWAHDELFTAAVTNTHLLIMPVIENYQGTNSSNTFRVGDDIPAFRAAGTLSGGFGPPYLNTLVGQIEDLVNRYLVCPPNPGLARCAGNTNTNPSWPSRWATMYDRNGTKRFAINLLSACSNQAGTTAPSFSAGLDNIASRVLADTGFNVGFTLDIPGSTGGVCPSGAYIPTSNTVISSSTAGKSILAVMPFRDEIGPSSDLGVLIARKRAYIDGWVTSSKITGANPGLPVILDVTAGYDGHIIFPGTTMYGRNDTWRNYQSQMKGNGVKGIVFDAWNGYTEGWTGMESCGGLNDNKACSASQGNKDMYNWISNIFSFDPRNCDSYQFLGGLPVYHVYGAICTRWYQLNGSTGGLGDARSSEHDSAVGGARVTDFASGSIYFVNGSANEVYGAIFSEYAALGKENSGLGLPTSGETNSCVSGSRRNTFQGGAILWSGSTGAHEVHGLIGDMYRSLNFDCSSLGLPISDEEPSTSFCSSGGRRNRFQHGTIEWCPGWSSAQVH